MSPPDPGTVAAAEAAVYDFAAAIDTKDRDLFRRRLHADVHLRYGSLEWHGADPVVEEFAAAHELLSERAGSGSSPSASSALRV